MAINVVILNIFKETLHIPGQTDDFYHRNINQFLPDDKNQEWMMMMMISKVGSLVLIFLEDLLA